MNAIAQELNKQLTDSVAARLLSDLGKKMFFPKGIVAQSAEATQRADKLNATIGMAYKNRQAFALPLLGEMLPGLSNAEAVAYAPTAGVPALRRRWRELQIERNPAMAGMACSLPVVVAGLTSGIFQIAELFANPGDRVLIPDMFWGNYRMVLSERREAVIENFRFFNDNGRFNLADFAQRLGECAEASRGADGRGKLMVLLNFPNNPTGYSPTESEAHAIAKILGETADKDCDILTVHDDAYFGLFYEEDLYRQSLFTLCGNLHENILAVKIDGATKEEYAWGFRVGFMSFASKGTSAEGFDPLIKKLMGSIRGTVSNCPGISQNLLLKIFDHPGYRSQKREAEEDLTRRYLKVRALLDEAYKGSEGESLSNIITPLPFNSGYFMAFRIDTISAEDLRLSLLDRGIGSIAIGENYLRLAFAAIDEDDLAELYREVFSAARNLADA